MKYTLSPEDINAFLHYLVQEEKSPATIQKYRHDLFHFYSWLPKEKAFDKDALINYKERLLAIYRISSVNSMLAAVNSFLTFQNLAVLKIKQIKLQRRIFCSENRELTKNEYLRLVRTADQQQDKRLSLIMQTLCTTGIRISELPFITVESVRYGQTEVSLKGKTRAVWLPKKLRQILMLYIKKQNLKKGPVFVTSSHSPVHRSNIWAAMKAICKEAGVSKDKVFPHNLRHLFARTFYQQERDLVRLADILGHANIETTRIYTISAGREHERQINRLGLLM